MSLALGTTLAAIAIGHFVAPTKLRGWTEDDEQVGLVAEKFSAPTELEGILYSRGPLPTRGDKYAAYAFKVGGPDRLQSEIESYQTLENGWDGEGSMPPPSEQADAAKRLIGHLPAGIERPKPMLSSSGEIGFYWKADRFLADIEIDGPNSFSLFARSLTDPDVEIYLEDLPISEAGAAAIKETLNRL
ncbi:MAG: hypothetical protein ROZ64_04445 [Burkholderiaceae bacterium]|jgi:hypothetical protein|nr:hypothetical protein [Burkholderiaceae bacterium]